MIDVSEEVGVNIKRRNQKCKARDRKRWYWSMYFPATIDWKSELGRTVDSPSGVILSGEIGNLTGFNIIESPEKPSSARKWG